MSEARLVQVTFIPGSATPIEDLQQVHAIINAEAIDWMRIHGTVYLLWTQIELTLWTLKLTSTENLKLGHLFICAIDPEAPLMGWMPQWVWDWFEKYRPFTPVPRQDARPNPLRSPS